MGGGEGVPRPRGAWERAGQGPDSCPPSRTMTAGAGWPGLDQRSTLFANPPAFRGPVPHSPCGFASGRGPRPLTCRVAAVAPLLLHLATRIPDLRVAGDEPGLEVPSSSPSPPPPRIPGAETTRAQRRSHGATEGAAPCAGHPGPGLRLHSQAHCLAGP